MLSQRNRPCEGVTNERCVSGEDGVRLRRLAGHACFVRERRQRDGFAAVEGNVKPVEVRGLSVVACRPTDQRPGQVIGVRRMPVGRTGDDEPTRCPVIVVKGSRPIVHFANRVEVVRLPVRLAQLPQRPQRQADQVSGDVSLATLATQFHYSVACMKYNSSSEVQPRVGRGIYRVTQSSDVFGIV